LRKWRNGSALPGPSKDKPEIAIQARNLKGQIELKYPYKMSDAEFQRFCADNPELKIEQDPKGKIIIMPPVELDGGARENAITSAIYIWWKTHQKGLSLSPSAGFKLPDGSTRSADGAWVSEERLAVLSKAERKRFAPVVPDFVVEIRSENDRMAKLKRKMSDVWIKNGVRLAWLIDPKKEQTFVYRADGTITLIEGFDQVLTGEGVCEGLMFDLSGMRV
jgi:Uma2 family endonuclease